MLEKNIKKLSIIIPVYNSERYIKACLESVFRQGIDDSEFEVLLIDDGTEDNSFDLIEDIISSHDNLSIFRQNNQGPSVARNLGLQNASGQFVMFIDSDDLLVDNCILRLLSLANEKSADLVVGDYIRLLDSEIPSIQKTICNYDSYVEKNGAQFYIEDLDPRHCYVWRILYNRSFLVNNKIRFGNQRICFEDIPFIHECYLKAGKCIKLNSLVCIYRVGHESISSSMSEMKMYDLNLSIEQLWGLQNIDNLSKDVLVKLRDNIFSTFSFYLLCISHNMSLHKQWKNIVEDLKNRVPDIWFDNGVKQRIVSWMFWKHPKSYFGFRSRFISRLFCA